MPKSAGELAESKLIILYFIYKINLPISVSQITEFVVGAEYMDYFSLQQYLIELVDSKLLSKFKENNNTCYKLTDEGVKVLVYFVKHIPESIRNNILNYINQNKKEIKKEFDVTANWFYNSEKDYLVKCGVYDNDITLMEINLSVVSKEFAKQICNNWKQNINTLYGSVINLLISEIEDKKK